MTDRDLYSIEQARVRLGGISRNTIYLMLNSGELTSVLLGRRRFISSESIAKLISSASTSAPPSERGAKTARTTTRAVAKPPRKQTVTTRTPLRYTPTKYR